MAVTQDSLMALESLGKEFSYADNDTMLYALSIGMGADPMNRKELAFCYEKGLKVIIAEGECNVGIGGIISGVTPNASIRTTRRTPSPGTS